MKKKTPKTQKKCDHHSKREHFIKPYYMQLLILGGQVCDVKFSSASLEGDVSKASIDSLPPDAPSVTLDCQFLLGDLCEDFLRTMSYLEPLFQWWPSKCLLSGARHIIEGLRKIWQGIALANSKAESDFGEARIWSMSYRYLFCSCQQSQMHFVILQRH